MKKILHLYILLLSVLSVFSQKQEIKIYNELLTSLDNIDAGKFSDVIRSTNHSLEQSIKLKNDTLIAQSYNLLGIVSTQLKENKKAIF